MEVFSCVENPLGGSIPDTLGLWKSLTTFYSGGCNLYGSIPRSIFNLSLLVNLSLAENHLTGSLPSEIGNENERFLKVSYNQLLKATDGFSKTNLTGEGSSTSSNSRSPQKFSSRM
ncbi:leucine-rich repeat protein [Tanacetum coccineum]